MFVCWSCLYARVNLQQLVAFDLTTNYRQRVPTCHGLQFRTKYSSYMLRRPPTRITLRQDDLDQFDAEIKKKEVIKQGKHPDESTAQVDPIEEHRQRRQQMTTEERMGIKKNKT